MQGPASNVLQKAMPCHQLIAELAQLLEVSSPELKLPRRQLPPPPPPDEEPAADLAKKRPVGCLLGGGQGREDHAAVLSNQGLLGEDKTVDSVDQHCKREMFIQSKNAGFEIVVIETNYALAVETNILVTNINLLLLFDLSACATNVLP